MTRAVWGVLLVLAGCGREEPVRVYRAPPESARPAASAPRPASKDGFAWTLPADWSENPRPGSGRLAEFRAGAGADAPVVTLIAMPGDAGGLAPNVNRWRGQAGLDPLDEPAVDALAERSGFLSPAGRSVWLPGPERAIACAFLLGPPSSVFLKMEGPKAAVEARRGAFESFARTMKAVGP